MGMCPPSAVIFVLLSMVGLCGSRSRILRVGVFHSGRTHGSARSSQVGCLLAPMWLVSCSCALSSTAGAAFAGGAVRLGSLGALSVGQTPQHVKGSPVGSPDKFTPVTSNSDGTLDECDDEPEHLKLVLCVRSDLGMSVGKISAQVGHAVHGAIAASSRNLLTAWEDGGSKKVVVEVGSEAELVQLQLQALSLGLVSDVVQDAGHTEVDPGTTTVLAVGPAPESSVDVVTGNLRLLPDPSRKLEVENAKLHRRVADLEKELSRAKKELSELRRGG